MLYGVVDRFLGNLKLRDRCIAHITNRFDAQWAGVIGVHHHSTRPIEKLDAWPEFSRLVAAIGDQIEQRSLLVGLGIHKIGGIAPLHRLIEPRDAASID